MLKNISYITGAVLVASLASTQAFAAPAQSITTDGSGSGANNISVSGTIPEYIRLIAVDNEINLMAMSMAPVVAGPAPRKPTAENDAKATGLIDSTTIPANSSNAENGYGEVRFDSNTYISVDTTATRLTNTKPGAPPYALQTEYARGYRGQKVYVNGSSTPFTYLVNANSTAANFFGFNSGFYAIPTDNTSFPPLVFGPGADSGFRIKVRFLRSGLNDRSGIYNATLNHSYTKY